MTQRRSCAIALLLILQLVKSIPAETIPPQVAGGFYPAGAAELKRTVEKYVREASTFTVQSEIVAALVPHAGYAYSGKTAALVYRILQGRSYPTVIIIATGHRHGVRGAATIDSGGFATPLGKVPIDEAAVKTLQKLTPLIEHLPQAYQREHSIEVQLPFLQTVLKNQFKIVPLLMNNEDPKIASQIGEALAQFMKNKKMFLLVSSDLAHYPDTKIARLVDSATLKTILEPEWGPAYLWQASRFIMERGPKELVCTYCGEAAVLAALYAMDKTGTRAQLLQYVNSGELPGIGDTNRTVGYASLLWLRGAKSRKQTSLTDQQKKELLRLARQALLKKLNKGEEPERKLWPDPELNLPASVFVTLRRKDQPHGASLRGCIGSLLPDLPLAEAVQVYAIKSALEDPRFQTVKPDELTKIHIEISKLTPFRKTPSHEAIKSGQGVLLGQGRNSGLFLPSVWEDIPAKENFLGELCQQKARLPRDCWKDPKTEIQVFDAEKFEE
ncbi:MAG: AmmeMemoRadiSam system protein B [Elusimicrobia bacterium]|nr:AmmeMemoRadiSam system protein B [Elusimicrobiota bacterium]